MISCSLNALDSDAPCVSDLFEARYFNCCTSMHGLSSKEKPTISRNSINAKTSIERVDKILKAGLLQQGIWSAEDSVKAKLKRCFLGTKE